MTEDLQVYLAQLLTTRDIGAIPRERALKRTAHLVDLSSQFKNPEGTRLALQWCDQLEKSNLTPGQRSLLISP